jgi:hypothetical protein
MFLLGCQADLVLELPDSSVLGKLAVINLIKHL